MFNPQKCVLSSTAYLAQEKYTVSKKKHNWHFLTYDFEFQCITIKKNNINVILSYLADYNI